MKSSTKIIKRLSAVPTYRPWVRRSLREQVHKPKPVPQPVLNPRNFNDLKFY